MKPKIKINNRLKAYGETDTTPGKRPVIEINLKANKTKKFKKSYTWKQNLADSVYHEKLHAKHPKMLEKTVYKKTAKAMKEMSNKDMDKMVSSLKGK